MSRFRYSGDELDVNKVLKMNQDVSKAMENNRSLIDTRNQADSNIDASMELLASLGKRKASDNLSATIRENGLQRRLEHRPEIESWQSLVTQANNYEPNLVSLEDIMTEKEIDDSFQELEKINKEFSRKTSLVNKKDLSFLVIAMALQVVKNLIFPYIAEKFDYGKLFDKSTRLDHNDKSIEDVHRKANDRYRDQHIEKNGTGYWINILYQTPPYDITRGSAKIGINMGGAYHRLYTLGHDPILGWIFGTMNILTDVITLNDFKSYRVVRKPKMMITPERVSMGMLLQESYDCVKSDYLNLPAAIFAQAQHLKSDEYTKLGLPVPILEVINEDFASELYKNNYDSLCLARDVKIVGSSFIVSKIIDMIISLVHGLFREKNESREIYEVRTRKILLISNTIATSSTVINTCVTKNLKNLDIGGVLNMVTRLFTDIRFITKIKEEFVASEISDKMKAEIDDGDQLFDCI